MPAYLQGDAARGAGYGVITVPGLVVRSEPAFALYRASDGQCLSPQGWQNSETYLNTEAWDCDTGALRLAVDASVVDHMDALDTYRLLVREAGAKPTSHTLLVKDIMYSSMNGGQGIVTGQSAPPPAAPQPAPTPEPEPEPMPEPEPAPTPAGKPVDMPDLEMSTAPRERGSKMPLLIGLLVLLLAAGGGIWWYLQKDAKPEAQSATPPQAASAPSPTSPASPAAPAAAAPTAMQQAREHLRSGGEGTKGWELAQNLLKEKGEAKKAEAADAAFLLVEDAAQKNVGPAMLRLAAFYDPTDVAPKGSIAPDVREAYAWYVKARDAGQADAQTRLGLLRAYAETQAAKGDAAAKALLAQWK